MTWYKISLPLILFCLTVAAIYFFHHSRQTMFNPIAANSRFYSRLNYALNQNQIKLASPIVSAPHQNQVEFTALNSDSKPVKVIFSSQKDPYLQTTSLQQIFKIATIKGKYPKLIDLSLKRPYATLKNN